MPDADPPTIRIRLLGPLDVQRSGRAVELPARKTEALLSVLALRPGVAFNREWLAALLWPDVPEAQGRTSLRQALGHLRKAIFERVLRDAGAGRPGRHARPAFKRLRSSRTRRRRTRAPRPIDHFKEKISFGREPEPGEPARWLLHVNALKRAADADYLVEGLVRAGLEPP